MGFCLNMTARAEKKMIKPREENISAEQQVD